jgi:hypothetical protein
VTAACQIKQVGWGAGKHQMFVNLPSTINSLRVCQLLTVLQRVIQRLIQIVPLLEHLDLLRRFHFHQSVHLDTIPTYLLSQGSTNSHIRCDGTMCCYRRCSFLHIRDHLRAT